jgi:hypothetical protein
MRDMRAIFSGDLSMSEQEQRKGVMYAFATLGAHPDTYAPITEAEVRRQSEPA